jgi:NitT/TauT family transport system ATP-binding protein
MMRVEEKAMREDQTEPGVSRERRTVLSVRELSKVYSTPAGPRLVLDNVDLDVAHGALVCIVGPSGAGKTTLLRCIAGLTAPTSGVVLLEGEPVDRPPARLAVVFQDYSRSLMPWMSVVSNVTLPLRGKGLGKSERLARARAALEGVGLADHCDQYPWQLSGGMQQRVAIARALAYEPEALLMDEPFASVDAQTRAELENLTLAVRAEFGVTVVLVTHDIDEAVYLGDEVVVLSGTPTRVRDRIAIGLGSSRDQLTTKALPEFATLRTQVLQLIQETKLGKA